MMNINLIFLLVTANFLSLILFAFNTSLNIPVSLTIFVLCFIKIIRDYFDSKISLISLVLCITYSLPFLHIIPYLWFDFNNQYEVLWGLRSNEYMFDKAIIELTSTIGAVGLSGIVLGLYSRKKIICNKEFTGTIQKEKKQTMSLIMFSFLMILNLIAIFFTSPAENIFQGGFGSSLRVEELNFNSAWLIPYLLGAILLSDGLLENIKYLKKIKIFIFLSSFTSTIIYFNFLRGDRESLAFIIGSLIAIFSCKGYGVKIKQKKINYIGIIFFIFLIQIFSSIISIFRSDLVVLQAGLLFSDLIDLKMEEIIKSSNYLFDFLLHGTWSATLLTPLSVAGDYINGNIDFKLGASYWDTFISLPPGFITDIFGYERTITLGNNITSEIAYGLGGVHSTVIPFLNFGLIGVLLIHFFIGKIISFYERFIFKNLSVINLSLIISTIFILPHWLWYTEEALINAIFFSLFLIIIYRFIVHFRFKLL